MKQLYKHGGNAYLIIHKSQFFKFEDENKNIDLHLVMDGNVESNFINQYKDKFILHQIKAGSDYSSFFQTWKIAKETNIEDNEITLDELTNIITMLNKYYHLLEIKWLNYYKYYFTNIKAILVSLIYKKTFMLNINIYNSLNFYSNLLNNNFNKVSLLLITKINTFNHLINERSNIII